MKKNKEKKYEEFIKDFLGKNEEQKIKELEEQKLLGQVKEEKYERFIDEIKEHKRKSVEENVNEINILKGLSELGEDEKWNDQFRNFINKFN